MGHKYALVVVDDATAYKWYFVMKSLKEVGTIVKTHIKQQEKQLPYTVKRIRTDGGTEFVNTILNNYCKRNGLVYQQSNVESREENGSAERAHQTIMGKVRWSGMAAKWWPEALKYMTAKPTARLKGKCPYEVLFGTKPTTIGLQIWGSTCYAHIPKIKRANQKLSERVIECKLLGLSDSYKGYRLLDIKENRYLIARDVKFGTTYTEGLIS
ncbi:Transposon Polyprotein integrase, partial [Phytophthora palmivora]